MEPRRAIQPRAGARADHQRPRPGRPRQTGLQLRGQRPREAAPPGFQGPDKNPTRDGAWFWGQSYDHCTGLLPVSSGILRIGREAFAAAMVAAEEDYRQRARMETRSRKPDLIAADGLRRLGVPPHQQEVSVTL